MRWRWNTRHETAGGNGAGNGHASQAAKREAEQKLEQVRRREPEVRQAADTLARWIEEALRGAR
jgi:hypothetical protein